MIHNKNCKHCKKEFTTEHVVKVYCSKECSKTWTTSKEGKYNEHKRLAIKRGIEYTLTFEQFIKLWQKPCNYCRRSNETIKITRHDYNYGYVTSSCAVCSTMKGEALSVDYINHCKQVAKVWANHDI